MQTVRELQSKPWPILVLSYFDSLVGPTLFKIHPPPAISGVKPEILQNIASHMDIHHETAPFQICFSKENLTAVNLVFLLRSEWARGLQEICMVSILDIGCVDLIQNNSPLLEYFKSRIVQVPEVYKGLYLKNYSKLRLHPEINDVHQNLSQLMEVLHRKIPKISGPFQKIEIGIFGLSGAGKKTLLAWIKNLKHLSKNGEAREFPFTDIVLRVTRFLLFDADASVDVVVKPDLFLIPNGVVVIVDGTDASKFPQVATFLREVLDAPKSQQVPIAILNNKNDVNNYARKSKLLESLHIENILHKTWQVFDVSALTGDGVQQALNWLVEKIAGEGVCDGN